MLKTHVGDDKCIQKFRRKYWKIEPISNFATWWERHVNQKYLVYFVLQKHAWALDHNYLVLQSLLCPV
jgi:hypothetical protein